MSSLERLVGRFLLAAISVLAGAAKDGDTQFQQTPMGMGAKVGFDSLRYHNTCVWFRVVFISGEFFKDLQEHKTANGIEFRKKKQKTMYVSFPDQLLVDVEAFPRKCTVEMTPPDYAAGLLEKPSFEVAWKRGQDEARPVQLLATEEHHNPLGLVWSYVLTVPSTAVPLTDSLLIDVSLRHGICRTHLTASLDSRQRTLFPSTCG